MELVEREVEGMLCGTLLAPQDWTLRVHHNLLDSCPLHVAQFEQLDGAGRRLYVAEHFPSLMNHKDSSDGDERGVQVDNGRTACDVLQEAVEKDLKASSCLVWEMESGGLRVCIALYAAPGEESIACETTRQLTEDLRRRYANAGCPAVLQMKGHAAMSVALYSARGNCTAELLQPPNPMTGIRVGAAHTARQGTAELDEALRHFAVASGLHLEEGLCFPLREGAEETLVLAALLRVPLTAGVCGAHRAWSQCVQRMGGYGWRCVEVMRCVARITPHTTEMDTPQEAVEPASVFYRLSPTGSVTPSASVGQPHASTQRTTTSTEGGDSSAPAHADRSRGSVLAWVTAPRVGSDAAVVFLTPAPNEKGHEVHAEVGEAQCAREDDTETVRDGVGTTEWRWSVSNSRRRCERLCKAVRLRLATRLMWSPLCLTPHSGLLVRHDRLVLRLPTTEAADYMHVAALPLTANATLLGALHVSGVRREAVVTLLREYRSAEDYNAYLMAEFTYDAPNGLRPEMWRHRRQRRVSPSLSNAATTTKTKMASTTAISAQEESMWLRLGGGASVYSTTRECGTGRLLLTQAFVTGEIDEQTAEEWERWVDGITMETLD